MGKFKDTPFVLQKTPNPHKASVLVYKILATFTELCGTVDVRITASLQTFFLEPQMVNTLHKGQKNARVLAIQWKPSRNFWRIEVQDLVDEEIGLARVTKDNNLVGRARSKVIL